MNSDYFENKKYLVRPVLLGVSAILAVLALAKLRDYYTTSARAQSIVRKAVDRGKADPNRIKENLAECAKIADTLKKNSLFVPRPPKRHPVSAVLGIMGSEALINGKWYKLGDKISDAEIVAIEPTLVKIKWDGKEKVFAPISAVTASAPEPIAKVEDRSKGKNKKEKPKRPAATIKPVKEEVSLSSGGDDPLAWMGVKLPEKLRGKILKMWNNASEEDKRRGMAEWNNASDEKRSEMLSQLEAMPDE